MSAPGKPKGRPSSRERLHKRARMGFRGYPVGTIAFYGKDDKRACKVAAAVILGDDQPPAALERWWSDDTDIRYDEKIIRAVGEFLRKHEVRTIAIADKIMGCPHEEGKDYPEGEACPECPFWAGRDRFTGKVLN